MKIPTFPTTYWTKKKSYWKVHIMKKSFRNSLFWELQQQSKKRSDFRPVFQKIVSRSELTTKRRISPKPVFSSNSQCVKGLFFVQKFNFIKKSQFRFFCQNWLFLIEKNLNYLNFRAKNWSKMNILRFSKSNFWSQKFKFFHENSNIFCILDLKL